MRKTINEIMSCIPYLTLLTNKVGSFSQSNDGFRLLDEDFVHLACLIFIHLVFTELSAVFFTKFSIQKITNYNDLITKKRVCPLQIFSVQFRYSISKLNS